MVEAYRIGVNSTRPVGFESWRCRCLASVLVLLLLVSGCRSPEISSQSRYPPRDPFHQITIGLCEDYPEESRSLAAAHADLLLLKTNNIRVLRFAFGWDAMEPERGQFDWTFWDDFVATADKCGIRLIPYVCYTPKWAASDQGTNFWRAPPKDLADFKEFFSKIVGRYKGSIHSWEVWNEPDNAAYWSGSVEDFAKLLKAGSEGIREADPKAKVVSGGIAWNVDFLRQLFEEHRVSRWVDIVNVHNYNETWAEEPLERIYDVASRAKKVVMQYGSTQPVWFAEVGYSDYRKGKYVSDIYNAQFPFEHTAKYQGVSIGRAITVAAANGNVPLLAWYRIHDLPQTQEVIGDVNNRHLGIVTTNGEPKSALVALRFFHSLFSPRIRCLDGEVRSLKMIESDVETHVFESETEGVFAVAWLRPISHRVATSVQRPMPKEQFDLWFPFTASRPVTVCNERGEVMGRSRQRIIGHNTVLENVALRDGELRVIFLHSNRGQTRH